MFRASTVAKTITAPKFSATILKPRSVKVSTFRPVSSSTQKPTLKHHTFTNPLLTTRLQRLFVQYQQPRYFSTDVNTDSSTEPHIEIKGNQVPKPIATFDEIPNLPTELRQNIHLFGWKNLIKVQQYAIPAALQNRDLLISSQTGTGKTAAFLIPMMMNILNEAKHTTEPRTKLDYCVMPRGLILVPTRELAQQVTREAEKLGARTNIRTIAVFGGTNIRHQLSQLYTKPQIVVATPGRFIDLRTRGAISTSRVNHVVLDEGDMMLDMGFMPAVQDILGDPAFNPKRQLMFFSATFAKPIRAVAEELLRDPVKIFVGLNKPSALITQKVVYVSGNSEKEAQLLNFVRTSQGRILVFAETKRRTDAVFHFLRLNGIKVACIHGDHAQTERDLAVAAFSKGDVNVLVATNVASRGLDIKGINHVVNYDFPKTMEPYIHRIGRTGRAGVPGTSLSFFSDLDFPQAADLVKVLKESEQEIPDFLNSARPMRTMRNIAVDVPEPPTSIYRPPPPFQQTSYQQGGAYQSRTPSNSRYPANNQGSYQRTSYVYPPPRQNYQPPPSPPHMAAQQPHFQQSQRQSHYQSQHPQAERRHSDAAKVDIMALLNDNDNTVKQ